MHHARTTSSNSPAILLLEDGTVFEGKALGAQGTSVGEIAFNTGMYGYQEIFTDPSYHRQMLVMATAHIGNYMECTITRLNLMELRLLEL